MNFAKYLFTNTFIYRTAPVAASEFTIKREGIQHIILETLTNKNSIRNLARVLGVGDPRNFHNSYFVENFYLNLNVFFFKYCQVLSTLKTKRIFIEICQPPKHSSA